MDCKYCGQQLPEDATVCPACGKALEETQQPETALHELPEEETAEAVTAVETENADVAEEPSDYADAEEEDVFADAQEETEDEMILPVKPSKPVWWKVVAGVLAGVLILGILGGAVWYWLNDGFAPREDGIRYKDSYTVDANKANRLGKKAVATVADKEMSNAHLQIYYNMTVSDFTNYYGYYLSSLGLDLNKPADEQVCTLEEDMTWQQYFLDNALGVWHRYTVLCLLAEEEGITIPAEQQAQLDTLRDEIEGWAGEYGYVNGEAMLHADFGPMCTMDAYMDYMYTYTLALQYQNEKYASISPTDEEVSAYFEANKENFAQSGITKEAGSYYDVRHILIKPMNGTTGTDGVTVYADEDWAECLVAAEDLLEQWKAGDATEESFAELAVMYSEDGGSSTNGGLYTDLTADTSFVEEFKAWYMDESRQVGDTGIVKTMHGYHIMFFSGSREIWKDTATTALLSERWNALIEEGIAKWPMYVNYKNMALCELTKEEPSETVPATTEATQEPATTEATE